VEGAQALGIKIKTPTDGVGPLIVLKMKDSDAAVKKLGTHNVITSNRMDGLRVSFHLYNTLEDVHTVLDVLSENLHLTVRG